MTKKANPTSQIHVRDLTDATIAEAVLFVAGRNLYKQAIADYSIEEVNKRMFRLAQEMDHPGITDAEISELAQSMSSDDIVAQIDRANMNHYNYLMTVEIPGEDGKPVPVAVLSKQEGVREDSVAHLVKRADEFMNGVLEDGRSVGDLPVIALMEVQGSTKLQVRSFEADLKQLAKDIAEAKAAKVK